MLRLSRLLWVLLLIGAFVALGNDRAEAETGLASWYGPGFEGSVTASGEVFDPSGFTAAHRTLPFGTRLTVTYGGRSAQVTVNDRGPYSGGRALDLSQGAAEYLGLTAAGVDWVDYTVTGRGGYRANATERGGYRDRQPAGYRADRVDRGVNDSAGLARDSRGNRYTSSQPHRYAPSRLDTGGGARYVVRPGDTLWEVAARFDTSAHHLAAANGIQNPDVIMVGQKIRY